MLPPKKLEQLCELVASLPDEQQERVIDRSSYGRRRMLAMIEALDAHPKAAQAVCDALKGLS